MRIVAPALMFAIVIGACIFAAAVPSCSGTNCKDPANAATATCKIEHALTDCTGADVADAIAKYGPTVKEIVDHGRKPDGSVDWLSISGSLEDAALKYGGCVLADVFSGYVFAKKAVEGSAANPTPASAKDEFDRLRAKVLDGHQFKTKEGTL